MSSRAETIALPRLRAAARKAFAGRGEVVCAYAFGSRISGRPLPDSDLDVALVLSPGAVDADPLVAERLASRLSEALDTGLDVDARDAGALPLALQGRVVTEGVLIHDEDPVGRVRFETDVRRLYFDFLPLIERDASEGLTARG